MILLAFALAGFVLLGVLGCVVPSAPASRRLVYGGCTLLSCLLLVSGVHGLGNGVELATLPIGLAGHNSHFRLDQLASLLLIIIALGACGSSVFALGYTRSDPHPERVLPFYPWFIGSMIVVVIADDAFSFLFGWELMSLASWALVSAHHREPENAQASFVYLIMAVFSGFVLLFAFALLAGPAGQFGFDAIRAGHCSGLLADIVLALALLGAGTKAGLMPMHAWLPLAHPAAPSHVSALMSGVMTKVAIYAFLRIGFDLVRQSDAWVACIVLLIGGATAAAGVLQAIMERDIKRLLAFSTIENIGIIFIGIGLALAFRVNTLPVAAALAMTAALFHCLNHTAFKSLLFLAAGTVTNATGQRSLEEMGGLIHRLPRTAVMVLIGCVAIAGLPPLNGFVSEWLTIQAMLVQPDLPQWGLKLGFPVAGALLALTAALAACCFVRLYGICFLGRPRSGAAAEAREADAWSVAAISGYAALCVVGGLLPGPIIDRILSPAVSALLGAQMPQQLGNAWLTIVPIQASRSSYNGLLICAFILISAVLGIAVARWRSRDTRIAPAWDCGFPDSSRQTQYSGDSFAQPIRRVFSPSIILARDTVDMPSPGELRAAALHRWEADPVWDGIYRPLGRAVLWLSARANFLQMLTIRRYLGFVFASLILLLVTLTVWQ